ncbi:S4 domain-containing protein YaaA [Lapidilactobacillus mulanensis]|uniref:S4 domain-containing protein YaaA n=1 Tax=Lapidilactobacillus mulanensis TaxID=2485999 RepID=A0ABW4DSP5_9LACO|nr:S4 domain-containing protein YaaA [Lapidilactobacillus mulanensis]
MKQVRLADEYLTLTQLLKEEGIIGSGGQAKFYLQENPVLYNGESENRRGKKLHPGDVVKLNSGEEFQIVKA